MKKLRIIKIYIFVVFPNIVFAQLDSADLFKIFRVDDIYEDIKIWTVYNENVYRTKYSEGSFGLLKDTLLIYEFNEKPWIQYFDLENPSEFDLCVGKDSLYYHIDLVKNTIKEIGYPSMPVLGKFNNFFVQGEARLSQYIDQRPHIPVLVFNSELNGAPSFQIDLSNFLEENYGVYDVIPFPLSKGVILATGLCYIDGCEDRSYYIYSYQERELKPLEIDKQLNLDFILSHNQQNLFFVEDFNYEAAYVIHDETFRYDPVMHRQIKPLGLNISDGELISYIFESRLNKNTEGLKRQRVIISAKLYYPLEKAIYKVIKGEYLTNRDFKGLDFYDLQVLKNAVFAKYNYDFDSPYYQALFNLYSFYDGEKRIKAVNNKLTEVDRVNLALILKQIG